MISGKIVDNLNQEKKNFETSCYDILIEIFMVIRITEVCGKYVVNVLAKPCIQMIFSILISELII